MGAEPSGSVEADGSLSVDGTVPGVVAVVGSGTVDGVSQRRLRHYAGTGAASNTATPAKTANSV